ncbi:MAG: nucleotidyltransferase substrate binding protein [Deltaproteobacteria bacterium]|nr:nucleotidyltransferase substrate binding protein [Deltaproteobacteria bacterium]
MSNKHADSINNLNRALRALRLAATTPVAEPRDLAGIIKNFEIVYELSWKTLKRKLENAGHNPSSARSAFEMAFELGWIENEEIWLAMIADRNLTVHTYNETFAEAMIDRIRNNYLPAYEKLLHYLH